MTAAPKVVVRAILPPSDNGTPAAAALLAGQPPLPGWTALKQLKPANNPAVIYSPTFPLILTAAEFRPTTCVGAATAAKPVTVTPGKPLQCEFVLPKSVSPNTLLKAITVSVEGLRTAGGGVCSVASGF